MIVYICQCYSLNTSHHLPPCCVHKSILYVCDSIPALQIVHQYHFSKFHLPMLSHVRLFATLWTIACQAPLFMGFSRQEYLSVLPSPGRGDLPNPGTESPSPGSPARAGGFFTICIERKWKLLSCVWLFATPWTVVHGIFQARILEWVPFPFSRGSSQLRDWTLVSCMPGAFFTRWATREA